ncbi:pilus assembly FimT family protein [Ideonella sp.]|uniref:pilus assembly FimT family protein n=1 Tax=Ideonella sp. TaxID=1929293 RepID=UPI002B483BD0|nr:GspH/FimT family pseudopilin [Ideonella sp.]HJV68324.1 GspH/FimT family pseudopilin [Ideonella sp.]
MLTSSRALRGFSLIELMVTLGVAALLLLAAVPAMQSWVADARVRTAAESFQNAARLAQGEAMRRSRTAVLVLTDSSPTLAATPAAGGQRWIVRLIERSVDDGAEDSLFVRGGGEAAAGGVTVQGSALTCFNAFGQLTTLSSQATGLDAECEAPTSSTANEFVFSRDGGRSLKVLISRGGQVRLCDAQKTFSDDHPDGCPSAAS